MEPKARAAQPFDGFGIERSQNFADTFRELRRQMLAVIVLVKSPQPSALCVENFRLSPLNFISYVKI
jgi:hypothetical protein